jgi:hypothetical protein
LVNVNAKEVKLYEAKIAEIKRIDANKLASDIDEADKALINRTQVLDRISILQAEFDANEKAIADARIQQIKDNLAIELDAIGANENAKVEAKLKADIEIAKIQEAEATRERELQNTKLQMASDAIGALASLIDATSKKDEKSQKKAFQINKAASIGQALISTYLAANSALASPANNLFPGQAQIAAGVAIIGGMANVAKISRTQFGSGGGGGGNPPAPPAPSSTQQPSATPSFNLYGSGGTANNQNAGGANGGNGQNITVTAVVSETDMTNTQNRVNSMKSSASL